MYERRAVGRCRPVPVYGIMSESLAYGWQLAISAPLFPGASTLYFKFSVRTIRKLAYHIYGYHMTSENLWNR